MSCNGCSMGYAVARMVFAIVKTKWLCSDISIGYAVALQSLSSNGYAVVLQCLNSSGQVVVFQLIKLLIFKFKRLCS